IREKPLQARSFATIALILAAVSLSLDGCVPAPTAGKGSNVITVDAAGTGGSRTIQAAIDGARPGSHIQIKPGTYAENLRIGKDLFLEGMGASPSEVIIESGD